MNSSIPKHDPGRRLPAIERMRARLWPQLSRRDLLVRGAAVVVAVLPMIAVLFSLGVHAASGTRSAKASQIRSANLTKVATSPNSSSGSPNFGSGSSDFPADYLGGLRDPGKPGDQSPSASSTYSPGSNPAPATTSATTSGGSSDVQPSSSGGDGSAPSSTPAPTSAGSAPPQPPSTSPAFPPSDTSRIDIGEFAMTFDGGRYESKLGFLQPAGDSPAGRKTALTVADAGGPCRRVTQNALNHSTTLCLTSGAANLQRVERQHESLSISITCNGSSCRAEYKLFGLLIGSTAMNGAPDVQIRGNETVITFNLGGRWKEELIVRGGRVVSIDHDIHVRINSSLSFDDTTSAVG